MSSLNKMLSLVQSTRRKQAEEYKKEQPFPMENILVLDALLEQSQSTYGRFKPLNPVQFEPDAEYDDPVALFQKLIKSKHGVVDSTGKPKEVDRVDLFRVFHDPAMGIGTLSYLISWGENPEKPAIYMADFQSDAHAKKGFNAWNYPFKCVKIHRVNKPPAQFEFYQEGKTYLLGTILKNIEEMTKYQPDKKVDRYGYFRGAAETDKVIGDYKKLKPFNASVRVSQLKGGQNLTLYFSKAAHTSTAGKAIPEIVNEVSSLVLLPEKTESNYFKAVLAPGLKEWGPFEDGKTYEIGEIIDMLNRWARYEYAKTPKSGPPPGVRKPSITSFDPQIDYSSFPEVVFDHYAIKSTPTSSVVFMHVPALGKEKVWVIYAQHPKRDPDDLIKIEFTHNPVDDDTNVVPAIFAFKVTSIENPSNIRVNNPFTPGVVYSMDEIEYAIKKWSQS